MTVDEKLIHELGDRLNALMVTVDLAARLLEQVEHPDASAALERAREDCEACADLMARLRQSNR